MKRSLLLFALLEMDATAFGENCTSRWELIDSRPYRELYYMETHVTYRRIKFTVQPGEQIALRIQSQLPEARYMNYSLYEQETMDSMGSVADHNLATESDNACYTIWLSPTQRGANHVPLAAGGSEPKAYELWYRLYVPADGVPGEGGVGLPQIEAFDAVTGAEHACPIPAAAIAPDPGRIANNLPPAPLAGEMFMYRAKASQIYANPDNIYLASQFPRNREITVFRFRAPSFGLDEQVRYWSLCTGGLSTLTSACLSDYEAIVGDDGMVSVVVGPAEIEGEVSKLGLNFIDRGRHFVPVLIYRNVLAQESFAGDPHRIPERGPLSPGPIHDYAAQNYIGDFAPIGRHCTLAEFRAGSCQL
jgi:hypothetical protein